MKKVMPILLAVAMLACLLCACGDDANKDDSKTVTTTKPVDNAESIAPSQTKIYYQTDAAGQTITTVIVLPGEGETFPIKTADPSAATSTAAPTFEAEDDSQFNDAELDWG